MKSQTLQDMVKKIFGDEKTKAEFVSNPESVISQYSLTEQEKKAVLNTSFRFGLVSSGSTELAATMERSSAWNAPMP
jgi:hypothetical protein